MDVKECDGCGYSWNPRTKKPKRCPLCGRWVNKPTKKKKVLA